MGEVAGEVVPLALAIAASPFTIIPVILLLLTPRAAATAGSFLGGWVLGLAVVATAFTLLASVIELYEGTPTWASWGRIAIGTALVVLGIRRWLKRATPKPAPAWMARVGTATPRKAFRLAIVLALANPKVLLLAAAAGLSIGAAELTGSEAAVAVAVFTAVASVSVAVPVLLYLVRGERMRTTLTRAHDWLERNNAAIMATVFVLIGIALVVKGVSDLR
jgi:threonine/homoserine/homoserine lactone efflux protein